MFIFQLTYVYITTLVHWLAFWFCDPQFAGSNSVVDCQGYELFGEITLKNLRIFHCHVCCIAQSHLPSS